MGSVDQELLYALRAMSVLLSTGVGLESAMKHVADTEYGEISNIFGQTLRESAEGGGYLSDSLQKARERTNSEGLKKALNAMILGSTGEINLVESLEKLAEKETRNRQVAIEKYIESLGSMTEAYLILGILVPIMIVAIAFVDKLTEQAQFGEAMLTEGSRLAILMGVLSILGVIVIVTKVREPKV